MKYLLAVMLLTGCATVRKTGMDKPKNRFGAGVLIAIPGFITGAALGTPIGWGVFGVGWALGMSGAIEGCARQGGC